MGKKEKIKKKHNQQNVKEAEINLDIIKELGGEKKDLELLADMKDEDAEVMDYQEDFEAEPIKRDELRDFIKELGFHDIMERIEEDIETGEVIIKDEITEELEESESGLPMESQPKKEKKMKNKFKKTPVEEPVVETQEQSEIKTDIKSEIKKVKKSKNKYKTAETETVQVEEVSSTTGNLDINFIRETTTRKHTILKPGPKWYEYGFQEDPLPTTTPPGDKVQQLMEFTARILADEVAVYRKQQESSRKGDASWIRTVLSTGTLPDKMAAWTLLIQEAPLHNLTSLDLLVNFVVKKGRREALMAMDKLKDLFITELLPDGQKLQTFDQHPLSMVEELASGNRDTRDKRLILWYYEDLLKKKYADFVQGLENLCHDNIREVKHKALSVAFSLLASKPEQEKKLLTILINKLGDPDIKVAANAAHQLTNLVQRHPNMKQVIIAEVERLMYRPNVAQKAQYYSVCFLNQILLDPNESDLALRLINIYFSFFKSYVKKGEIDGKMLSALLTGVNRAYPYAKEEQTKISEQMDTLYKVVHIVNFNTSVQALMLLYQVVESSDNTSDRYYQALYRKLLDPGLITSSKQSLFLNLVYKSLKKDTVDRRLKAFVKRILQICSSLPPPFICGCLILLSEIMKVKPSVFQFNQMSGESDDEDEHFEDAPEDDDKDDDDEEEEPLEAKQKKDTQNALGHVGHTTVSSWVHRKNIFGTSTSETYDPHHRNPLYCHADSECVWELDQLSHHYHPTVALFASNILAGEGVSYTGDPLNDFTLIRFLDRFVYRNPKKHEKQKEGNKIHEHLQSKSRHQVAAGARGLAVNTEEYVQTDISKIPVEEQFFHKYFSSQALKKAAKEEESGSDIDDEEFDTFLDSYEKGLDGADFKLDFSSEFSKSKGQKKDQGEDEDEDEDDDDISDEEVDFDDEDFGGAFDEMDSDDIDGDVGKMEADEDFGDESDGDLDEEAIAYSDDDDLEDSPSSKKRRKSLEDPDNVFLGAPPPGKKKRRRVDDVFDPTTLFAAAEEFGDIMDDNASSKLSDIGSEALSNKDNAHVKQLTWEHNRDKWMRGQDWKTRKRPPHGGHKKGVFGGKKGGYGDKKGGYGDKKGGKKVGKMGNKSFPKHKHGKKGKN